MNKKQWEHIFAMYLKCNELFDSLFLNNGKRQLIELCLMDINIYIHHAFSSIDMVKISAAK